MRRVLIAILLIMFTGCIYNEKPLESFVKYDSILSGELNEASFNVINIDSGTLDVKVDTYTNGDLVDSFYESFEIHDTVPESSLLFSLNSSDTQDISQVELRLGKNSIVRDIEIDYNEDSAGIDIRENFEIGNEYNQIVSFYSDIREEYRNDDFEPIEEQYNTVVIISIKLVE